MPAKSVRLFCTSRIVQQCRTIQSSTELSTHVVQLDDVCRGPKYIRNRCLGWVRAFAALHYSIDVGFAFLAKQRVPEGELHLGTAIGKRLWLKKNALILRRRGDEQ